MPRSRFPGVTAAMAALVLLTVSVLSTPPAQAVPFRPDVLQQVRDSGALPSMVAGIEQARLQGLDRPPASARGWLRPVEGGRAIPDRNAIVILVDFSDKPANQQLYPSSHYTDMLFSVSTYPSGSMRDWYLENSYGVFNVTGEVTIWLRMPQPYTYYVDGQAGFGAYPHNAQKLAEDAVVAANPYVDFSQFDNDGPDGIPDSGDDDGFVDALFVVHAGPGREETGSDNDIHSHAWQMNIPQSVDGVTASSYCMEPDNGKRGVFGHEFGHILGLPDLYDPDYSSSGVGDWCMMSFGSWGNGGLTPVHFLSWCKAQLGFLEPTVPLTNVVGASIPKVETNPTSFNLWTGGYPEQQYFTVENRQRTGSDAYLPGDGLIICHIDEGAPAGNSDEDHPLVAVEQADGLNELHDGGGSDNGDPWPGSTNHRDFTDTSNPNTRDYDGHSTQVAVKSISNSGAAMTANLEVENAPIFLFEDFAIDEVTGNGDGDIDPGEQWDMPVTLYNRGLGANNVTGDLSTSEVRVSIQNGNTSFGTVAAESEATGAPPFRATLQAGAQLDGIPFTLGIHYGLGQLVQVPFLVGVNDPLEMYRWTHENVSIGYGDQWHLSGQRNHTPGGAYAWKCGDTGNDVYANLLDAALVTRPLPLATVDAVRFWHWIDAEDDANFTAWDGGIVEASIDGGAWFQITPDGGYPYTIIANPASPFPGDTPCYSGSHDWSEARFDLTGLNGNSVRLRFRFGSDGYVTYEGWYIDDVVIEGSIAGAEDVLASGAALQLSPARPNPASGPLTLSFVQPAGVSAHAALVDATGRRLATWDFPASAATATQRIAWDGRLANGERAASGVYFFRLEAGSARSSQRVLWIR